MTTSNPTTGQPIKSRANSDAYSDNYDAIFGKNEEEAPATPLRPEVVPCTCKKGEVTMRHDAGSHYEETWLECTSCGRQGKSDFDMNGAINNWNNGLCIS